MYDVEIRQIEDFTVAYLEHRGPYMEIGRTFDILFGTLGARNLITPDLRAVAIYFDDPDLVPAAELKSRPGVVIGEGFPVAPPLERFDVVGGRYAVLRHKGPYADMKAAYDWLFGKWLVQSGHDAAEGPMFEAYLNNPRDTRPSELRTDIHLPLRELRS